MVELKVRLGSKGQIVIPKILREYYNIFPNQEVIVIEQEDGVLIKKEKNNQIDLLERIAKIATAKRKGKKVKVNPHAIYKQYEKRARRAGL